MTSLRVILAILLLVVSATPGCPAAVVRAAAHAIAASGSAITDSPDSAQQHDLRAPEGAVCCPLCAQADGGSAELDLSMAASSSAPGAEPCDCVGCAARDLLPTIASLATLFDLHTALPTPLATLLGVGLHDGCWIGGMQAQLACRFAAARGEVDHPPLGNGRDVLRWQCALVV